MRQTEIDTSQKNINLETVENCNLLCKLILDYMDTDKCTIQRLEGESFRIVYPPGSFINHKDTNYELTYAYFFYPSRHSIDGQKYDLEINLYHGNFIDSSDTKTGMVAHTHYHNDDDDTNLHKHFHYHLPADTERPHPNTNTNTDPNNKNIITCLMYNKGKHDGSDLNIFFNQFVHHPKFRSLANTISDEKEIQVHDHWSIEKLYPKKRSFFIYDDKPDDSASSKNTYVVFDTVQTISKELIDRLYVRGIKDSTNDNFDISSSDSFVLDTPDRVMYRKNIEVITDAAYKKSMRAQIKDLLSLTRMSTYKPSSRTSREYNEIGDSIIDSYVNGDNVGFFQDENKSKEISKMWDLYGRDNSTQIETDDLAGLDKKDLELNSDVAQKFNYVENIQNSNQFTAPVLLTNPDTRYLYHTNTEDYPTNTSDYLVKRRALSKLFTIWLNWDDNLDDFNRGTPTKDVSILGPNYIDSSNLNTSESLFPRMLIFFKIIILKFLVSGNENDIQSWLSDRLFDVSSESTGKKERNINFIKTNFPDLVQEINTKIQEDGFETIATEGRSFDFAQNLEENEFFRSAEAVKRLYSPATEGNYKNFMSKNGITNFDKLKEFFQTLSDGAHLLEHLCLDDERARTLNLRVLFEDIDGRWKEDNNVSSSMMETLNSMNDLSFKTKEKLINDTSYRNILSNTNYFDGNKFVFVKMGKKLERTISNEECQPWLSNQVHYEGDLWKFWEKNIKVGHDERFTWDKLTPDYKQKIRDGLIRWDEDLSKWKTHQQCRNPGNRAAAPWCYTKNPNKRWEYCQKPYYSTILGKIILFLIFISVGVIAFFTIKTLFLHEYPMRFVEKLTGGKMASTETFGTAPTAPAVPTAGAK
jgi:carbonic anhydrase